MLSLAMLIGNFHTGSGQSASAYTASHQYCGEQWTVLWTTPHLNEDSHFAAENTRDHTIIWVSKSGLYPEFKGKATCTYPNGTVKWQKDLLGYFNASYSVPFGVAIDAELQLVYISAAFHNETSSWQLGLFVFNATTGLSAYQKIIATGIVYGYYPDGNYEDRYSPLALSPNWDILLTYLIREGTDQTTTHMMVLDGPTGAIVAQGIYSEVQGFPKQWVVEAQFSPTASNEFYLLIGADNTNGNDSRTIVGRFKVSGGAIQNLGEITLSLSSQNSLRPISMVVGNGIIYCAVKDFSGDLLRIAAYTSDLTYISHNGWVIEDVFWQDMALYKGTYLKLVGFGTQSFNIGLTQEQGFILTILIKDSGQQLTAMGAEKYGDPSYEDRLYGVLSTSTGALYLCGAGTSYGDSNTYGDYDAYFIKWSEGTESSSSSTGSSPTEPPSCNCITKETLMYSLIGSFIGILGFIYALDFIKKKRATSL